MKREGGQFPKSDENDQNASAFATWTNNSKNVIPGLENLNAD